MGLGVALFAWSARTGPFVRSHWCEPVLDGFHVHMIPHLPLLVREDTAGLVRQSLQLQATAQQAATHLTQGGSVVG